MGKREGGDMLIIDVRGLRIINCLTTLVWLSAMLCTAPSVLMAQPCERYESPTEVGDFSSPQVDESSGIVISSADSDLIWTHNDSGGSAIVYGATLSGSDRGKVVLNDTSARDWEDISAGPCGASHCLYVGDIGDNGTSRSDVTVHRFEEPSAPGEGETSSVTPVSLTVTYAAGAMDSEALVVDPQTGDVFIFEKSKGDAFDVRIYRILAESWIDGSASIYLALFETLDLSGYGIEGSAPPYAPPHGAHITAGDFSPDGSEVMLKTYEEGIRLGAVRGADGAVTHFEFRETIEVWRDGQCESITYHPLTDDLWYSCEGRGLIAQSLCVAEADSPEPDPTDPSDPDSAEPESDDDEPTEEVDTDDTSTNDTATDETESTSPEDPPQESEGGCQQITSGVWAQFLSILLLLLAIRRARPRGGRELRAGAGS